MDLTIQLSQQNEARLREQADAAGLSLNEYASRLLMSCLAAPNGDVARGESGSNLIGRIAGRFRELPGQPFDEPRTDGASQHDHYIYGAPKNESS